MKVAMAIGVEYLMMFGVVEYCSAVLHDRRVLVNAQALEGVSEIRTSFEELLVQGHQNVVRHSQRQTDSEFGVIHA